MRSLRHAGKAMKPSLSFLALGKRKLLLLLSGIERDADRPRARDEDRAVKILPV